MKETISELLAAFPPCVIRLLARQGKGRGAKRLTHDDIAKRSGISYEKVRDIAALKSWDRVAIADADAFMKGHESSIPFTRSIFLLSKFAFF